MTTPEVDRPEVDRPEVDREARYNNYNHISYKSWISRAKCNDRDWSAWIPFVTNSNEISFYDYTARQYGQLAREWLASTDKFTLADQDSLLANEAWLDKCVEISTSKRIWKLCDGPMYSISQHKWINQ